MQVSCPHCQKSIDWTRKQAGDETISLAIVCPNCDAGFRLVSAVETQILPGRIKNVAQFSLQRILGKGAFGTVWLARDNTLGRDVALKLPVQSEDPQLFLHEARAAASLRHDNIVSVFEVGTDGDQAYIAAEFIDGITLHDRLTRGRLTSRESVELCISIGDALHHAHGQGVVHRDLKPANILLDSSGRAFITDFGIAKHAHSNFMDEGSIVGTPDYMSPEQAEGHVELTGPRSDIYALGVVIFELLTGNRPYRGNASAVMNQKIQQDAPSLRILDHSIAKDLETLCLKCLERDPEKRYATALEVADELRRFLGGHPIKARPIPAIARIWRWCIRRPALAGLLACVFFSLTGGLAGVSWFWLTAEQYAATTDQSLYRTRMGLTSDAMSNGDVAGMRAYLEHYMPPSRIADLRDFEWRHFHSVSKQFLNVVNHGDSVTDVAISSNGELIASCGLDRVIRVWSTIDNSEVRTFPAASAPVSAIEFSPTEEVLASTCQDGLVRLWVPREHDRSIATFDNKTAVTAVQFSADGQLLTTAGIGGIVRLWDRHTGQQLQSFTHPGPITAVRISLASRIVVTVCDDRRPRVWDLDTGKSTVEFEPCPRPISLALSQNGKMCAVGTMSGRVMLWSLNSQKLALNRDLQAGPVGDLEFLQNGTKLAAVTNDGRLRVLQTKTLLESNSLSTHTLSHGVIDLSERIGMFVVGSGDGGVKTVRVDERLQHSVLWHDSHVRDLAMLPDDTLISCDGNGAVQAWNIAKGLVARELRKPDGNEMLAIATSKNSTLVAAAGMDRMIHVWDASSRWSEQLIKQPGGGISALALSDSAKWLAAGSKKGEVWIYDTDTGGRIVELLKSESHVQALCFIDRENSIAVARSDGFVTVHDVETGQLNHQIENVDGAPVCFVKCDQGKALAIGTQTGRIHVWDIQARKTRHVIRGHSTRVNDLAVCSHGGTIISAGRDKTIKLWDVETGESKGSLDGHNRQVFAVCIGNDDQLLASGGLAGDIRLWHAPKEASVTAVSAR